MGRVGWCWLCFLLLMMLTNVLNRLDLFLVRRLLGSFFGIVLDFATIVLVLFGDGSSGLSGLCDAVVGVG
jgi:uncharacterized membrane protein required for colicin V production